MGSNGLGPSYRYAGPYRRSADSAMGRRGATDINLVAFSTAEVEKHWNCAYRVRLQDARYNNSVRGKATVGHTPSCDDEPGSSSGLFRGAARLLSCLIISD